MTLTNGQWKKVWIIPRRRKRGTTYIVAWHDSRTRRRKYGRSFKTHRIAQEYAGKLELWLNRAGPEPTLYDGPQPQPEPEPEVFAYDLFVPEADGLSLVNSFLLATAAMYVYAPLDFEGAVRERATLSAHLPIGWTHKGIVSLRAVGFLYMPLVMLHDYEVP